MAGAKKIVIVDYQLGNLYSVKQACLHLGVNALVSSDKAEISNADAVILPGVGAFGDAMNNLHKLDLVAPIKDFIASGKPFMGICLGLQLLFSESEEFGSHKGLELIEGSIRKFSDRNKSNEVSKVPQIQWNKIEAPKERSWKNTPLESCDNGEYMYFVHSFYAQPVDSKVVLSETEYGDITYCSSVQRNNIFACQFHPEKSGEKGLGIYKWWLENLIK